MPGGLELSEQALLLVVAAPMMAGARDNRLQIEPGYGGDDIESDLALDAHRLKGKCIVEPAYEAVRSNADTDCCSSRSADISASQRTCADARGRGEDGPSKAYVIGKPDLGSKTANNAPIILDWRAGGRPEDAIECTRRHDDKAFRPRASAAQHARLNIGVGRCRRRQGKSKKRGGGEGGASSSSHQHGIPFHQHTKQRATT
jgi:hypothetical protein